jgi:hypothetical protein
LCDLVINIKIISVIHASIGDRVIDKNEMEEPLDKTFPFDPLYLATVILDEGPWGKIWMVVVSAEPQLYEQLHISKPL